MKSILYIYVDFDSPLRSTIASISRTFAINHSRITGGFLFRFVPSLPQSQNNNVVIRNRDRFLMTECVNTCLGSPRHSIKVVVLLCLYLSDIDERTELEPKRLWAFFSSWSTCVYEYRTNRFVSRNSSPLSPIDDIDHPPLNCFSLAVNE